MATTKIWPIRENLASVVEYAENHLNTHCVHNHLVINSVSYRDGKKLNNNYAMYFEHLRAESDRLCCERGLSVIEEPGTAKKKRYQQNELYDVIRSDMDEAIRRAMTLSQFYMVMRSWGYVINDDPKRKYATIRSPGTQNRIRFKTLGEDYTPEVITRRIMEHRPVIVPLVKTQVKRYRYKGSLRNMKPINGIDALFLIFVLILRKIRNINRVSSNPVTQRYTPELRAAVRQIERYSEQTLLLCRHMLKSNTDVTAFIDNRKQGISTLEKERGEIYNRMRSVKTPIILNQFKVERDALSKQITAMRKEVKIAQGAFTSREDIRSKLQAQSELDRPRLDKQQTFRRERGREFER